MSNSEPISVLLADDHDVVRRGLRAIVNDVPGWRVAAEADNGSDALRLALELRPDVVVIDFAMPVLNGIEAARRLCEQWPAARVLFLTMHDSEVVVRRIFRAGARGMVPKSVAADHLVPAIQTILEGKPYLPPELHELLFSILRGQEPADSHGLTSREVELVQLLSEGLVNKEIADRMHISVRTAESHRAAIMQKVGANSISELIRWAIRNEVIPA